MCNPQVNIQSASPKPIHNLFWHVPRHALPPNQWACQYILGPRYGRNILILATKITDVTVVHSGQVGVPRQHHVQFSTETDVIFLLE